MDPDLNRRQIQEADIDALDIELGIYYGMMMVEDFGSSALVVSTLAYHVTEDFFLELGYGDTQLEQSSYERLGGGLPLLTQAQRKFHYYDASVGYQLLPGEGFVANRWAFNDTFYLIAGVGNSEFAGDDRHTVVVGAGYRLILLDWLAWRFDVRDHFFDSELLGENKTHHSLSVVTGMSLFF